jgi:hypothetical protein
MHNGCRLTIEEKLTPLFFIRSIKFLHIEEYLLYNNTESCGSIFFMSKIYILNRINDIIFCLKIISI